MKLLLYGGCHALVIQRLIQELGPVDRHQLELIINFELVRSGKPFPYDSLQDYDAIIYSPIENKGEYNTIHLDAACCSAGVQAVRFPWLEWHGYAPGADKDLFWGHVGWFFPGLVAMAQDCPDLPTFIADALKHFPSDEAISRLFDYSTKKLRDQENRTGCEVRVIDFILEGFRDRRMFLLPDHPSLLLYQHVLNQLESVLGTKLISHWPDDLPEPQPEAQTPILPRVADSLNLTFRDESWRCDTQPLGAMTLDAFLTLHYARGQDPHVEAAAGCNGRSAWKVATASRATWIVPSAPPPGALSPTAVPRFSQMLIRAGPSAGSTTPVFRAEVVSTLAGSLELDCLAGEQLFRTEDWQCRA